MNKVASISNFQIPKAPIKFKKKGYDRDDVLLAEEHQWAYEQGFNDGVKSILKKLKETYGIDIQ